MSMQVESWLRFITLRRCIEEFQIPDVITTSASQRTRVDFSVSNQKARDEGGRDENCRL